MRLPRHRLEGVFAGFGERLGLRQQVETEYWGKSVCHENPAYRVFPAMARGNFPGSAWKTRYQVA